MDPDGEEANVFTDAVEPSAVRAEEEEDVKIFNAWMQRYRGGTLREKIGEEEEEDRESEEGRGSSRSSLESEGRTRMKRRASLPCPNTLSAMQLSRLHSSTQAPVTARVLLRRTSSRRLVPVPQEAAVPAAPESRPSLIPPTILEVTSPERRSTFRRRNVMSLSDAYSMCLICHNDLNTGKGGARELQCSHTFHRECIEEWFWRKQSCPTCHVQVSMPQPVD
ncbi:uncharacterized protein si:ch211-207l14.1 [Labrus bergylta]|uniref:uncharacterized protein si:ch211-207l14.1 n=1 Tax=Labrus bergylta TaxID=56723 RepID=UPI003313CA9C